MGSSQAIQRALIGSHPEPRAKHAHSFVDPRDPIVNAGPCRAAADPSIGGPVHERRWTTADR
jgi:hypothetical protein